MKVNEIGKYFIVKITREEIKAICEITDDAEASIGGAEADYGFESWDILTGKRVKKYVNF